MFTEKGNVNLIILGMGIKRPKQGFYSDLLWYQKMIQNNK